MKKFKNIPKLICPKILDNIEDYNLNNIKIIPEFHGINIKYIE